MPDMNIDYRHPAWAEFMPEWQMIGDCVDGERKVKKAGMRYLPHPNDNPQEDDPTGSRYESYKKRAAFVNATGRTLSGLIGIAFNKQPVIELSGGIEDIATNADGEGQPLAQLIRDALSQTLQRGRAGVFTDFTGSGIQSQAEKGRPVLRLFTAKQIINWRVTNGKTSLVVLFYEEPKDDPDGFDLVMVRYWIELRLVNGVAHWRKWEESAELINGTALTAFTDASNAPLKELPWSWIGSANNDHTPDSPPLADIAYLNIKHYQCEADLAEATHVAGQPMVALTGLTDEWADKHLANGFVIGSRKGVLLPAGGDLKFAQPEADNLILSVAERRENQMALLGAKLVERNTSARTATQASDEAQTDNSVLSLCAGNVEQAIHRALNFAVQFAGGGEYTVTLNKQYDIAQLDSAAITSLMSAVQSGAMRMVDFIRYQQRIGLAPQDEKAEDIEQELKDAGPTFAGLTNDDNKRSITE